MIRTGSWVKCLPSTTEGSAKTSPHNAGLHARRMTTPAAEMYRRIDEAVIDMINEFRIQRAAGPLPDKALDQIIFRAAHSVVQVLGPYTRDERNALWPSVLRMFLASFIREIGIADTLPRAAEGGEGQEEKSDRGKGQ